MFKIDRARLILNFNEMQLTQILSNLHSLIEVLELSDEVIKSLPEIHSIANFDDELSIYCTASRRLSRKKLAEQN